MTNIRSHIRDHVRDHIRGHLDGLGGIFASFFASLTHSLILDIGKASPTFVRSTTGTLVDFEDVVLTSKINESRFEDARRVENNLNHSEDLNNGVWGKQTGITVDDLGGVWRINFAADGLGLYQIPVKLFNLGQKVIASAEIKSETISGNIRLDDPQGKTVGFFKIITITTDWVKYESRIGTMLEENKSGIWFRKEPGGLSSVLIRFPQHEILTGTQTEASEYVSTGVSVQTIGDELVANGNFDNWTGDDPDNWTVLNEDVNNYITEHANGARIVSDISAVLELKQFLFTLGKSYKITFTKTNHSSGVIRWRNPETNVSEDILGTDANGTFEIVVSNVIVDALRIFRDSARVTDYVMNLISIKEELYHGANVDGVKYFKTDRSGDIIPEATLKGDLTEKQATNLFLNAKAPATQSITSTNTTEYTLSVTGAGSITVSVGGSGVASEGSDLTFTTTGTSVTLTITGSLDTAQLELGSFATSFIETAGTTVTRTPDELSYDAGDIKQGEGSIILEFNQLGIDADNPRLIELNDTTANNTISLESVSDSNAVLSIINGGVSQANITTGASGYSYNVANKIGATYKDDEVKLFLNGVLIGTDTSATIPTNITTIAIGQDSAGANQTNGNIKNVKIFKVKLSASEMIRRTT